MVAKAKATRKSTAKKKPSTAKPKKSLNASQRISRLENVVLQQSQQMNGLSSEIARMGDLLTGLSNRINATIKASEEGSVTTDAVNQIIIDNNVKELEKKVEFLVDQGVMTLSNDSKVSDSTFVIGREIDKDGNVVNPHVQFAVASVGENLSKSISGSSAGDVVSLDSEGMIKFEIMSVDEINQEPALTKKELEDAAKEDSQTK